MVKIDSHSKMEQMIMLENLLIKTEKIAYLPNISKEIDDPEIIKIYKMIKKCGNMPLEQQFLKIIFCPIC
ncbi:MAG: hypothetical protein SVM86_01810 [Candidatus Cloacimonadota bacterium]|nr:hypothetical protein [Candidatus Cloacimonadota bacterium]